MATLNCFPLQLHHNSSCLYCVPFTIQLQCWLPFTIVLILFVFLSYKTIFRAHASVRCVLGKMGVVFGLFFLSTYFETGWHISQADLKLVLYPTMTLCFWSCCIYLPKRCWNSMYLPPSLVYIALGIEPRVLSMAGKYSTYLAAFSSPRADLFIQIMLICLNDPFIYLQTSELMIPTTQQV